jgi:hypothetical protein
MDRLLDPVIRSEALDRTVQGEAKNPRSSCFKDLPSSPVAPQDDSLKGFPAAYQAAGRRLMPADLLPFPQPRSLLRGCCESRTVRSKTYGEERIAALLECLLQLAVFD